MCPSLSINLYIPLRSGDGGPDSSTGGSREGHRTERVAGQRGSLDREGRRTEGYRTGRVVGQRGLPDREGHWTERVVAQRGSSDRGSPDRGSPDREGHRTERVAGERVAGQKGSREWVVGQRFWRTTDPFETPNVHRDERRLPSTRQLEWRRRPFALRTVTEVVSRERARDQGLLPLPTVPVQDEVWVSGVPQLLQLRPRVEDEHDRHVQQEPGDLFRLVYGDGTGDYPRDHSTSTHRLKHADTTIQPNVCPPLFHLPPHDDESPREDKTRITPECPRLRPS